MSYADAARKGNYQRQQNERYYNEKMAVCQSREVAFDKLVDVLHEKNILPQLTAIQKVKYGVMYVLASDSPKVLENLFVNGSEVDSVHLDFTYYKANLLRVYVSNIPYGVALLDIQRVFSFYGAYKRGPEDKEKIPWS